MIYIVHHCLKGSSETAYLVSQVSWDLVPAVAAAALVWPLQTDHLTGEGLIHYKFS